MAKATKKDKEQVILPESQLTEQVTETVVGAYETRLHVNVREVVSLLPGATKAIIQHLGDGGEIVVNGEKKLLAGEKIEIIESALLKASSRPSIRVTQIK